VRRVRSQTVHVAMPAGLCASRTVAEVSGHHTLTTHDAVELQHGTVLTSKPSPPHCAKSGTHSPPGQSPLDGMGAMAGLMSPASLVMRRESGQLCRCSESTRRVEQVTRKVSKELSHELSHVFSRC
jgi:hypothetical protein